MESDAQQGSVTSAQSASPGSRSVLQYAGVILVALVVIGVVIIYLTYNSSTNQTGTITKPYSQNLGYQGQGYYYINGKLFYITSQKQFANMSNSSSGTSSTTEISTIHGTTSATQSVLSTTVVAVVNSSVPSSSTLSSTSTTSASSTTTSTSSTTASTTTTVEPTTTIPPLHLDGSNTIATPMQSSAEIAITTTNSPDVIVLDVDCADSPLSSITDSAGLTWHQRAEISTYNYDYEYYAIANQKLSSDIITATCSSPAYIQMTAIGISNANVTSPFDPNPSLPYAVPYDSSPMTGQISTTDKDDMLLFLGNIAGSPVTQMTVANGFTIVPDSYANSNPLQYQIVNNTESNLRLSSQFSTSLDWESISDAVVQAGSSSTENIPSYQNCSTEGDYGVNIPWATDNVLLQYDILQVNPAVLSNNGICWIRIGAYLNGTQATFVKSVLQHYPTSQFHYIVNLDPQMLMATYGENWTLADWNAYVTEIVDNQTYSGVHVWEIDNEVDRVLWCPQELSSNCYGYLYNGNPGNPALSYYNMLKDAYEIIKAHNSSDTVIAFGGLPAFVGGDYINSYYNTNNYTATPVYQFAQQVWSYGASQYCDAISVHLYTQTTFPNGTGVWYLMNEYPKDIDPTYGINVTSNKPVSAIMANVTESYEALTGKPIWFDEFGMPLSDPNYSTDNMQEASTYASEVVPFVSQFSFSKGAFVWDLFGTGQGDPSTWGILNGTTLQPNQEFSAYTALIK